MSNITFSGKTSNLGPMWWHSKLSCFLSVNDISYRSTYWLLQFHSSFLLICLGKQKKMIQVFGDHMEDPEGVLGTWLWPDLAPAVVATWGMNKKMGRSFSVSLPLSLSFCLPNIYSFLFV